MAVPAEMTVEIVKQAKRAYMNPAVLDPLIGPLFAPSIWATFEAVRTRRLRPADFGQGDLITLCIRDILVDPTGGLFGTDAEKLPVKVIAGKMAVAAGRLKDADHVVYHLIQLI